MTTSMHRLQLSLPSWQTQYLAERAERDGVSMAEVVRRLIAREASSRDGATVETETVLSLAGIAEDDGLLLDGIPVSEAPERYLESFSADDLASEVAENVPGRSVADP